MNVLIIGGGLSGIFAARTLKELGCSPVIIEKSRSVGGRMATRRIEDGKADHGAQFFTVRSKELQALTEDWLEKNWVRHWFGDDFPRYTGTQGMNALVKNLAGELPVKLNERVIQLEVSSNVSLKTDAASQFTGDAVILTAPVPQALELLAASPSARSLQLEKGLSASSFKPCFVGLFTMKKPVKIGEEGIVAADLPAGIDKIISNDQKGISSAPILSVYMTGDWSNEQYKEENQTVLERVIVALSRYLDPDMIESSQLKRWRYAEASHVFRQPYMQIDNTPVFIAGDSFLTEQDTSGRTRIESAILSGIRTGEAVHKFFS
ncbi:deoxyribodipyrimidine photolyase [Jeotgalibacillus sp. S-D1]|uniref:NAD(P)/FAD-dependent oxidoreductase n=1 Tax=Jeotgalibacillus sp. S-D1 TaxID=2552189 RepID=UPI0010593B7B|nr:FAD-dependent oxidoreductase [Jeotgalibacillus sp. S-D1]TDL30991.1 deoxyribodipyrimidine photolyase [Jeotgalibacillus sp. S-D1]